MRKWMWLGGALALGLIIGRRSFRRELTSSGRYVVLESVGGRTAAPTNADLGPA